MFTCPLIITVYSIEFIGWLVFLHTQLYGFYILLIGIESICWEGFCWRNAKESIFHIHGKVLSWGVGRYLKKNKVVILNWRCKLQLYLNLPKPLCPIALIKQKYHSVMWVGISSTATHTALSLCLLKYANVMYYNHTQNVWVVSLTHIGQVQFTMHFRFVFI